MGGEGRVRSNLSESASSNLLFQRGAGWLLLPCRSMTKALADHFFDTKAAEWQCAFGAPALSIILYLYLN